MEKSLTEIFYDTLKLCDENEKLRKSLTKSLENQRIYFDWNDEECTSNLYENEAKIIVSEKKSFEAASFYAQTYEKKKIAVLNFANAFVPGGGVFEGSVTQEESLCRSSTLYKAIASPYMKENFYEVHCMEETDLANDDLIYTPSVTVFKTDDYFPKLMAEKDWFSVDIITCAAPYFEKEDLLNKENIDLLKNLQISRIRHIMKAAVHNKVDILILGAFGCGAFNNLPEVVATAFSQVLQEFKKSFEIVEFAVYSSNLKKTNYNIFKKILGV